MTLSKIVRLVLLEAAPAEAAPSANDGEFQGGALVVTGKSSASEKYDAEMKGLKNHISPRAHVDPNAFIDRSVIGFRYFNAKAAKEVGDDTQILGDSAISLSRIWNSIVDTSVVSDGKVESSNMSKCDMSDSEVKKTKLDSCTIRKSNLRMAVGSKSTFEDADFAGSTVLGSKFTNCKIDVSPSLEIGDSRIADSVVSNTKINAYNVVITNAVIDKADILGEDAAIRIKGAKGAEVVIKNSIIENSPTIYASAGKAPQVINGRVGGNANVSGGAFIAGHVLENAVVFGDARIEAGATIKGTCRVGGTAVMVSGTWSEGLYTEGRHDAVGEKE